VSARDWIDKDSTATWRLSDASATRSKRRTASWPGAAPRRQPRRRQAEARFKSVSQAYGVLSDAEKRKQYDEARRLSAPAGSGPAAAVSAAARARSTSVTCSAGPGRRRRPRRHRRPAGRPVRRRGRGPSAASASRAKRGDDVETDVRIDFVRRSRARPCRCGCPARPPAAPATGPGQARHHPRTCPTARAPAWSAGARARSRSASRAATAGAPARSSTTPARSAAARREHQGAHADRADPVRCRRRSANPAGRPGRARAQRRSQRRPVRAGARRPHAVFGRSGDDLTVTVPVTFPELALGTTLTVPTLDSKVNVKVHPGTASAGSCGCAARASSAGTAARETCW